MPTVNLGRVGYVSKGAWADGVHKVNDTVTYLNGTYACILAHTSTAGDILPTNATYWQVWIAPDTMRLTGDQTASGVKTFSSSPVVPTPALGDNTTKAASTAFVNNNAVIKTADTGSAKLPTGTTAQRDVTPAAGWLRFNTTLTKPEVYNGSTWGSVGGGATGGGNDEIFHLNGQTVTTNYTVATGYNALTAGPVTIADGVTVTISDGSTWAVV